MILLSNDYFATKVSSFILSANNKASLYESQWYDGPPLGQFLISALHLEGVPFVEIWNFFSDIWLLLFILQYLKLKE